MDMERYVMSPVGGLINKGNAHYTPTSVCHLLASTSIAFATTSKLRLVMLPYGLDKKVIKLLANL